jgi:hypothetical protein
MQVRSRFDLGSGRKSGSQSSFSASDHTNSRESQNDQNWGAPLCFLQKSQRVLVFVERWSRRTPFGREGLCDWGASMFVKLGIPRCLSCCANSFCFFLHLRSTTSPTYTKQIRRHRSGDVIGSASAGQVLLFTLSEALKKFGLVSWPVGRLAFKDVGRAVRTRAVKWKFVTFVHAAYVHFCFLF